MHKVILAIFGIYFSGFCTDVHAADGDREVFQVIFGVRPSISAQREYGVTDSANYIVEAPNGDIVVAGNGASSYFDTGSRTKPMIARIDPSGSVIWRKIYEDLKDQEILAFAGKGDDQFIVLKKRVEGPSMRTMPTETISLRRVDSGGNISQELGSIANVRIYGIAPVVNTDLERFVFAGIDGAEITYSRPEIRDVRLHEIDLNGNVRRLAFPEGIKALRSFQHVGNDNFVFLRMGPFDNERPEIARVNEKGEVDQVIDGYVEGKTPSKFIATASRIFLIYQIGYRENKYRILAHAMDGSSLWNYDFGGVDGVVAATATQSGGLILSGSYEGNPLILAVSPNGEFQWSQRFSSAKAKSWIFAIEELSDGWLALAGSTGPGHGVFSSTDSDALLVVSGPDGAGLSEYSGCLADADEIERLRVELQDLTGIVVSRGALMSSRNSTPAADLPSLNTKVPATGNCGSLSEPDLRRFLRESVDEAHFLYLSKPSARAKIVVKLRPTGSLNPAGFRETGRFDLDRAPILEIEHRSGQEAMRYVAAEILPYTERFWLVSDQLRAAGRMWVGDRAGIGPPADLTFRELTILGEQFIVTLNEQADQDRRAFIEKFSKRPIVFSSDDDVLHIWGDRNLIVGKNRIDEIFEYVLGALPEIQIEILAETKALYSAVATQFKARPELPHAEYLEVLRRVSAAIESLSDEDLAVVRDTFAIVEVGNRYSNDLRLTGYGRQLNMDAAAAEQILSFIVENAEELQSQELRQ